MTPWQELILNRLNINSYNATIVIDHIGLLRSESFRSYLTDKQIKFFVAENIQEILKAVKSFQLIIVGTQINIPSFFEKKVNIAHFDYKKLPIEIEPGLLSHLTLEQLTFLISYLNSSETFKLVHKTNFKQILKRAEEYFISNRLKQVEQEINNQVESIGDYRSLLDIGKLLGEYVWLCSQIDKSPNFELIDEIDRTTEKLILNGYVRDAFYESVSSFKTVDKIIQYIKRKKIAKFALICFDAMGSAEWNLFKHYLSGSDFCFNEKFVFALVPTITRISRAAIFYGDSEIVYDLKTINEDKAFIGHFPDSTVRSFREGELKDKNQLLGINVVKIIYNVFDDIAHKTMLPPGEKVKNLYFKNVSNYLLRSTIKQELQLLKNEGFKLYFCSDHGSIVATGNGKKIDKYLIESSSKRATLIKKSELAKFYDINQYKLPFKPDKVVLLARGRSSFSPKNTTEITHGGITLDELIVPFVEVF